LFSGREQLQETGGDTVRDIDGNVYRTVKIGKQIWMAENLKVKHYRNGEDIPNVSDNATWEGLTTGAYCEYCNDVENAAIYGRLYNWYAVNDSRHLAPLGWHVPSDNEWRTLVDRLGGNEIAGGKMKEVGTGHWKSPNTGATNRSGFSALPGGGRDSIGSFSKMGEVVYFWSCTWNPDGAGNRILSWRSSNSDSLNICLNPKNGFSVRCVKD